MSRYEYVGQGAGVPGLPHRLTDTEAKRLGVVELLREAVKAGTYKESKSTKKREVSDE